MLPGWGLRVPGQSGSRLIPAFSDLTRVWIWWDINSQKKKELLFPLMGTWEEEKLVISRSVCCGCINTRFLPGRAMVLAGSEFHMCLRVEGGVCRSHRTREEIAQAWEDMKRRWGSMYGTQNGGKGSQSQWQARMTVLSPPLLHSKAPLLFQCRQQMFSEEQKGSILTLTVPYVA